MHKSFSILAGALALMVTAGAAGAQEGSPGILGIGFVSNAPDELVGATVWTVIPGLAGWGIYVDAKMDPDDPINDGFLYESLDPNDVALQWPTDLQFINNSRWRGFNVAITKQTTEELVLYAGGGYAEETVYVQFKDFAENRGILGWYWVEDPDVSRSGVNLLAGGFLRIAENMRIQFGGETRPMGFTVGLSATLGGP